MEAKAPEPTDETSVVTTGVASVSPALVWAVLVDRTSEWWGADYLGPGAEPMHLEPELGGRLWSGTTSEAGAEGDLHGSVRAFDPPERLEIGGILVPGAYAGAITVTIEATALGTSVRVEHLARGRITAQVEERMSSGWAAMLARLTELADTSA